MNWNKKAWILVGVVGAALVALLIAFEPVRVVCAAAFCVVVPGSGWAYRAGGGDAADRLALAVVISMSASILVATALVTTNSWSIPLGVTALASFAMLGFIPFTRAPWRPPTG